jgi:hypothetical protein
MPAVESDIDQRFGTFVAYATLRNLQQDLVRAPSSGATVHRRKEAEFSAFFACDTIERKGWQRATFSELRSLDTDAYRSAVKALRFAVSIGVKF